MVRALSPGAARRAWLAALGALALAALALAPLRAQEPPPAPGALLIVGGGGVPREALRAALARAASTRRVLILPQASALADRGQDAAAMWREAGAAEARVLDPLEPAAARAALAQADLIWLSGGDQARLVEALRQADLIEALRARRAAGAIVGGTSAGAAAIGSDMLTGRAEDERLRAGGTELVPGLGLWPEAIVDQHFLARQRTTRLLAAVLDRPGRIGVGIDERTALLVEGETCQVLGEGSVLVLDARAARVEETAPGAVPAAQGLRLHALRAGSRWSWRELR